MTRKKNPGEDKSGSGRQAGPVSVCGSGLPTPRPEFIALEDQATSLNENTDTSPQRSLAQGTTVEKALIVSAEMETVEALGAMATNVNLLAKMLETFESQASLLTTYHASKKTCEEIKAVQKELDEQREKERGDARVKRDLLKELTETSPNEGMREKWNTKIRNVIQDKVSSPAVKELDIQIPQVLKDQANQHRVRMEQIDNDLYNAEQRRRNAHVKEKEPLHRLRIPAMSMSRSSSGSTATPSTALLTPQNNLLLSTVVSVPVEDNVSPVFPKTVEQLYHYCKHDRGKLRQFLQDYGEDAQDESAYQFNKVLHFIGVGSKFHAIDPPAAPQPQSRLQLAAQNAADALLSPLMIAT
ncbi:hypothetical protein APHAL10511_004819 [Amanita phalloides]|nr:hypothetical protein APHAL10511_004819 [Amanita phalloides]